MKRLILSVFVTAMAVVAMQAARALSEPVTVTQPDGSLLTVIMQGDEHIHWYVTTDGVLLTQQDGGYYVARVDGLGELSATALLAHQPQQRSDDELAAISQQDSRRFFDRAGETMRQGQRHIPVASNKHYFPHNGKPTAIVILVQFSDRNFTLPDPVKSFDYYLNGNGDAAQLSNGEDKLSMSVSQYFKACSFGAYEPQFEIHEPVTIADPIKTFVGSNTTIFQKAIMAAAGKIDFSDPKYDSDNDGYIDAVCIMYAGYAGSIQGNENDFPWPHCSTGAYTVTVNGKTYNIARYCAINELNGTPSNKNINGIGLFCHEFSHAMGLPDLYPTDEQYADNKAMEMWSLMDAGEYINNGNSPAAYTAWEREAMGWMTVETLSSQQADITTASIDEGGKAYRIMNKKQTNNREYLMLENIQQTGINAEQKGHGLLVYHVNYASNVVNSSDTPNNGVEKINGESVPRPRMTVVPADGILKVLGSVSNAKYYENMAGDTFPGTTEKTSLTDDDTLPNYAPWTGDKWDTELTDITETDGLVSFHFTDKSATGVETICQWPLTTDQSRAVYNLQGQRVAQPQKGLYIVNGKKALLK